MRRSPTLLLLLGLAAAVSVCAGAAEATEPEAQLDPGRALAARQLARVERALAATARAARAPGSGLSPDLASSQPFWGALGRMSHALERADAGLRAGDSQYFVALGEGSRALAELEVVWTRARRRNVDARSAVSSGVAALSASYRRLRNGYGWETLRRGQAGALTPAEARRFRALRLADAKIAARVKPVEAKAAKAGDRTMAEQLRRLREQAQRIAAAEATLEAYLTAELLNDLVQGSWAANASYVKPAYRAAWRKAAPTVERLATDPGIGFVFTADLSTAEAWSFAAAESAQAEGAAPAAADAPAARPAARKAAPAAADTPVDDVEIVDGQPRRTEGVAPEVGSPAAEGAPREATEGAPGEAVAPAPSPDETPQPAPAIETSPEAPPEATGPAVSANAPNEPATAEPATAEPAVGAPPVSEPPITAEGAPPAAEDASPAPEQAAPPVAEPDAMPGDTQGNDGQAGAQQEPPPAAEGEVQGAPEADGMAPPLAAGDQPDASAQDPSAPPADPQPIEPPPPPPPLPPG